MKLSPCNFDQIFEASSGSVLEGLPSSFISEGDLFVCFLTPSQPSVNRIWLIDADDTIWEDNIYYEEITASFVAYVIDSGVPLAEGEIRLLVDQVEHETIPVHGFGAQGFELSLKEAWKRLMNQYSSDASEPSAIFEAVLPRLSGVPYEIPADAIEFLSGLSERENEMLVLFTQGPLEIQLKKIFNSKLASKFHAIAVGRNKKVSTYRELLSRLPFKSEKIAVVGNSINSEILPAVELGFQAFHYNNPNSWHAVNSVQVNSELYVQVAFLRDILDRV